MKQIKKKLLQPREYEIRIELEIWNSIAGGKLLCVLKTLVLEPKHFCFRILVPMSIKMLRINEKCKPSVRRQNYNYNFCRDHNNNNKQRLRSVKRLKLTPKLDPVQIQIQGVSRRYRIYQKMNKMKNHENHEYEKHQKY